MKSAAYNRMMIGLTNAAKIRFSGNLLVHFGYWTQQGVCADDMALMDTKWSVARLHRQGLCNRQRGLLALADGDPH